MFQDRILHAALKVLKVLIRGALAKNKIARDAALRDAEKIVNELRF